MAEDNWPQDYRDRGIERDTWACVNISEKRLAMRAVWLLARSGADVRVSTDGDNPKLFHVAVRGGLAGSPLAYVVGLRDDAYEPITCSPGASRIGQHPQATR